MFTTGRAQQDVRRLPANEYVDKMKGGWIGRMAGVGWTGPTECWCRGEIMPEERVPAWKPASVNQFGQDDIYVEMTFLQTLEEHGLDVSIRQAGIDSESTPSHGLSVFSRILVSFRAKLR